MTGKKIALIVVGALAALFLVSTIASIPLALKIGNETVEQQGVKK